MARTILITGATRGIGLELLRTLAAEGHTLIGTHRSPADADAIRGAGGAAEPLDVLDDASIESLGRRLADRPIDVLVNNAGINAPCDTVAELTTHDAVRTFRGNTIAPMLVARAVLPALRAGEGRTILHVSSIMGSIASTERSGAYTYRASKAALNMMNRCLAHELGPERFACVVLHPGWVRTDMGGPNAPLTTEQSARGIASVIRGLTPADNGAFVDYEGKPLPW